MNKLIFRELQKEDYKEVQNLICEEFAFNKFIKDEKILKLVSFFYLHECVTESTFSKVAEKDNKVIGIILGNSKINKKHIDEKCNNDINSENKIKEILEKATNMDDLKEFYKITEAYKEIIKGKEDKFEGSIQLFIVSNESRGLGIGKMLLNYLFEYMKLKKVNSLYLFTDTRCNYGFYDSQNFNRLAVKEINLDTLKEKIDVFLYEYKLNINVNDDI